MEMIKSVNLEKVQLEFIADSEACFALKEKELEAVSAKARVEVLEEIAYKELLIRQAKEIEDMVDEFVKMKREMIELKFAPMLNVYDKYIVMTEVLPEIPNENMGEMQSINPTY